MKTLAVIFGGRSAEHDVSIITAHVPIIQSLLATNQYDVWPIYISKEGHWYADQAMNDLEYFKTDDFPEKLSKLKQIQLSFDDGLTLIWPGFKSKKLKIDIAFPSMHGTYGEDGSLMGVLRMANIPFVGCDIFASATAMDKVLTKQIASSEGVPITKYVWFTKHEWTLSQKAIEEKMAALQLPLFVKPVHLGSSIGITKVKDAKDLLNAIEVALHYDDKVLVEEGVHNLIEVTLPIMGNEELTLASVERPLNKTEFFDFNDKYMGGGKKSGGANSQYSEIPANIDPELAKQVKDFGSRTYKVLGCTGIARIDFLIDGESKQVYMNEVNTLPGSLYHHNWKKSGVSGIELVTRLVGLAEERFNAQQKTTFTFSSEILKKIGGAKTQ